MSYTLDLFSTHEAPVTKFVDSTIYGVGTHALSRCELVLLTATSQTGGGIHTFSTLVGVADYTLASLLSEGGLNHEFDIPDGLYLAEATIVPVATVADSYLLNEMVLYNGVVYKCTTAGVLDNADPLLSVAGRFAVALEAEIEASGYYESFYFYVMLDTMQTIKEIGFNYLRDDCADCNPLCKSEDAREFFSALILIEGGKLITISKDDLAVPHFNTTYIESFNTLSTLLS